MLKRIYFIFIFTLACSVAVFSKEKTLIKGNFANSGNYKIIYLFQYFGSELIKVDSSKLSKGNFKFQNVYPRGFYKLGFSVNKAIVMVIGDELDLYLTADCNNFPNSAKISGSLENKLFNEFTYRNSQYGLAIKQLSQQTAQLDGLRNTDTTRYKEILSSLRLKEDSILTSQNAFFSKLYAENKGTFMSKFAKMFIIADTTNGANYFTAEEFSDEEYTAGEMLVGKINSFFSNHVEKTPQAFTEAAGYLLSKPAKASPTKELFYKSIINLFIEVKLEYEAAFRKQMAAEFGDKPSVKKYLAALPNLGLQIGDAAPEIFLPDTATNFVKLSSLRGKIVLLDFWASWCGPCRRENPQVVKIYERFKDKGLVILSVSLDESKQNWTNAIKKDKLPWLHVSDLRGWKSIAASHYGVQSIPQTFVLDKEGNIIGKNLRGEALERFLETQFK
jgi:peroxiredoxin